MRSISLLVLKGLVVLVLLPEVVFAQNEEQPGAGKRWAPFQVALVNPLQLQHRDTSIAGLRLNLIYGSNDAVWGIDAGLYNVSNALRGIGVGFANRTSDLRGLQLGAANSVDTDAIGIQAGLLNGLGRNATAVQLGLLNDTTPPLQSANDVYGLQVGALNMSLLPFAPWGPGDIDPLGGTSFHGIELGLVNAKRELHGISVGAINTAGTVQGIQVGAVNFCEQMQGLQVGFFNIITQGPVVFFPVINAGW